MRGLEREIVLFERRDNEHAGDLAGAVVSDPTQPFSGLMVKHCLAHQAAGQELVDLLQDDVPAIGRGWAHEWGLADDLQAGVPVERLEGGVGLEGHDQELEAFQFTGALEGTNDDGAHAAVCHE